MIKEERHQYILKQIKNANFIKTSELSKSIAVTEMTVWRDLKVLEKQGKLIRIHGGAKGFTNNKENYFELSHKEKINIKRSEKEEIAKIVARQIRSGDTIFLGAGTTLELVCSYLTNLQLKIVTNSIYVFNKLKEDKSYELILIGGSFRPKTGAFIGTIANDILNNIQFHKAFIGANGINTDWVTNSSEEEGLTQKIILNNAQVKYIVADNSKLEEQDFYRFYPLNKIDYLITDCSAGVEALAKYNAILPVINK